MSRAASESGILHLLLTAESGAWRECRSCCRPEDLVVLLDAAVMALGQEAVGSIRRFPCHVAVLLVDAHARGMPERTVPEEVEFISDTALVGLIAAHERCLTWR